MIDCTTHIVPVPHLSAALAGLRVAQLTDFHRGKLTPDKLLWKAVEQVREWQPDLILLTGDFVDSDPSDIAPCMHILSKLTDGTASMAEALEEVIKQYIAPGQSASKGSAIRVVKTKQQALALHSPEGVPNTDPRRRLAPLGVYAVPGNHDAKAGLNLIQAGLEGIGIVFLKNQSVRLPNGLWLVGLDEDYMGRPDVACAFADVEPNAPVLVMAHNPGEADLLTDRACVIFAGHTHGGQINVPILTARQLKRIKAKHYRAGWYDVGQARLYVNRGVGNTEVPFRFRCPPEAALFILKPA